MEETSAGAVIFRKNQNENLFLLLHYPSGHWDFVKGKMELNELPKETVTRETKEETGITDLQFIDGFEETIQYDFQFEGELIHKKVIFFLAKTQTEQVTISHEHQNYSWLNFDDAKKKTTFDNAKNILSIANELLLKGF